MPSSRRVFGRAIFRPGRAFAALAADPRRFRKGVRMTILLGLLTAAVSGLLGSAGALVTAPAIVPFSAENYYFYQMVLSLPFFFVLWLIASTWSHLIAKILGGRGVWTATSSGLAFAFALPSVMVLIPEAAFGGLLHAGMPQAEFMDLIARPGWLQAAGWAYHGLAALWLIYLAAAALRAGHGFSRLKAACAAILTSALYLAGFLAFIR